MDMHEKPTFSTKIQDKNYQAPESMLGGKKLTPEEVLEQEEAERTMMAAVLSNKDLGFRAEPYYAQDGSLRMRVRNKRQDIIYDDAFDQFVDLARKMSVHIDVAQIDRLTAEAKANSLEH